MEQSCAVHHIQMMREAIIAALGRLNTQHEQNDPLVWQLKQALGGDDNTS